MGCAFIWATCVIYMCVYVCVCVCMYACMYVIVSAGWDKSVRVFILGDVYDICVYVCVCVYTHTHNAHACIACAHTDAYMEHGN